MMTSAHEYTKISGILFNQFLPLVLALLFILSFFEFVSAKLHHLLLVPTELLFLIMHFGFRPRLDGLLGTCNDTIPIPINRGLCDTLSKFPRWLPISVPIYEVVHQTLIFVM